MTREKAKELLPVIQAYAEGKTIQTKRLDGTWVDFEPQISKDIGINFENGEHRIKPDCCEKLEIDLKSQGLENKDFVYDYNNQHTKSYRPFNDCDELVDCWKKKMYVPAFYYTKDFRDELSRPDIWVKSKEYGTDNLIAAFDGNNESIGGSCVFIQDIWVDMKELFDNFTFCDGSPCGVEEQNHGK